MYKKEHKLSGRQKKHYRAWGLTLTESEEYVAKLKEESKKTTPVKVHCSFEDYHVTDIKQRNLIEQAKKLYICGKHVGSKPAKGLLARIISINKNIEKYNKALKAMERIENRQKEIEETKENVD